MADVFGYDEIDGRGFAQRVGHVAIGDRTLDQLFQFRSRVRRQHLDDDPVEPRTFVISSYPHGEVWKFHRSLAARVIDGHRETNREGREQHLGRRRPRVSAANIRWFVGDQFEATHRDATPVSAFPVGGYFHE